jgi:hypothetical protein
MDDNTARSSAPPDTWDNSMRVCFKQCPRKFYFTYLRRLGYPPGETPVYFTFGRAFGEGMNVWYRHNATLPGTREHEERRLHAIASAVKLWKDEGGMDKGVDSESNLIRVLTEYFDAYPREKWSYVQRGEELGWVWPLAGTPYMLGGSLDGYAEWPSYGLFFVEHKTTGGYLTDAYIKQWYFSSQVTQYSWFLHNFHGGSADVYGGLLNLVTKQAPGPRSKWTTPKQSRLLIKKSRFQLEEFEEQFRNDLTIFERHWESWYWPMEGPLFPTMCSGGPGLSKCPFMPICDSGIPYTEARPKAFGLIEKTEKWEPWKRQGDT